MANKLIGTSQVGLLLGVTRQRVHQLRDEHDDFPLPAVEHPRAAFWNRREIARWAKRHSYPRH